MIFWIDAQLSPGLAPWIAETFSVEAKALREIGLRDAADTEIFDAARHEGIALVALIPKHQLGNVVLEALLPEPASWSLQEKGSQAGAWEPAKHRNTDWCEIPRGQTIEPFVRPTWLGY